MIKLMRAIRRRMYTNARILGDVQAVLSGRIVRRIVQRKAGAALRRSLNRVVK